MALALFNRILGRGDDIAAYRPLYGAIVSAARQPHWYVDGGVADTMNGRFEMICLIASMVFIRLEALGDLGAEASARLAEVMVEDLEGQVREIGFGDQVIGKRMGALMGAFGGRLGAYRAGLLSGNLGEAVTRNLYQDEVPSTKAVAHVVEAATAISGRLSKLSLSAMLALDTL
jgi:cytochrome b pre-mRNA-processing protein 3